METIWVWGPSGAAVPAHGVVDPGGEGADAGVDPRFALPAAHLHPPRHDALQLLIAHQRAARVTLQMAARGSKVTGSLRVKGHGNPEGQRSWEAEGQRAWEAEGQRAWEP